MLRVLIATLLATCLCGLTLAQPNAVYHNANVYTMAYYPDRAEAIVVQDGSIVFVGSNTAAMRFSRPGMDRIDLRGATVIPGLIDAHAHLTGLGQLETGVVDLAGTQSYEEVIERIARRAQGTPAGDWIIGRGWDHESWPSKQLPHHHELSEVIPDHPVWLSRVDGHAALANERAMQIASVSAESESPAGGEIIRDATGEPTGVFIDNAESLVARAIPGSAMPSPQETLLAAQRLCFEVGLTGVHDMGTPPDLVRLMEHLRDIGTLKLRVNAMISAPFAVRYFEEHDPYTGDTLSVNGVKAYADGAMGSRGAWLLDPYTDRPTGPEGEPYTGLAVTDPDELARIADHAMRNNYQFCAHAIGDRANRELLDIFEAIRFETPAPFEALRWRIEHAQLLHPADIPRFAELGVIASMQPTHCTSDMRWVADRVGPERARGAYAWSSLLRTGAVIASGSDFPVEHHNPLLGFYAAITRQNADAQPEGGWHPEQRLTRTEALRSMTLDAAYAGFRENRVGSIEPGKLADLVVLDTDIMTCEPGDILGARVLKTIVAGEIVYERE